MAIPLPHSWNLTPKDAIALQKELAGQVIRRGKIKECTFIAGADISYNRFSPDLYAAVVVLRADDMTVVETAKTAGKATFPYVPGLLTFREAPLLLELFARLEHRPDVLMVDGQGVAHPRRIGIASHLGLLLNLPTIGCAKSRLIGEFEMPAVKAGASNPLYAPIRATDTASRKAPAKREVIGSVVRTKDNCKPLFISVGHLLDLDSCVRLVLKACRGYRLPEPTRQAHLCVNEVRRQAMG